MLWATGASALCYSMQWFWHVQALVAGGPVVLTLGKQITVWSMLCSKAATRQLTQHNKTQWVATHCCYWGLCWLSCYALESNWVSQCTGSTIHTPLLKSRPLMDYLKYTNCQQACNSCMVRHQASQLDYLREMQGHRQRKIKQVKVDTYIRQSGSTWVIVIFDKTTTSYIEAGAGSKLGTQPR